MIRDVLKDQRIGMNQEFRFRGEGQTRLETFSDAVFALAITMLVLKTEVSYRFDEMILILADLVPFLLCMALIMYIWYEHFLFFIRYGFRSPRIVVLNSILLFFILFFVHPLKFLAKLLTIIYGRWILKWLGMDTGSLGRINDMLQGNEMPKLMVTYGLMATVIFFIMSLMYKYALKKSKELELSEIELFDTRSGLYNMILMGAIPFLSFTVAAIFSDSLNAGIISGLIYMLYFPVMMIFGITRNKNRKKLLKAIE